MQRTYSDEELHRAKMLLTKISAQFSSQAGAVFNPILNYKNVIAGLRLAYSDAVVIETLPKIKINFRPLEEMLAACNFEHASEIFFQEKNLIEKIGTKEEVSLLLVDFKKRISSNQNIATLLDIYDLAPATLAELLAFKDSKTFEEYRVVALGTDLKGSFPKIIGNRLVACFAAEGNSGTGQIKFLAKRKEEAH
jgi:hypothetical protein